MERSSSAVLNVPSGFAARAQGTLFAPGTCPPRNTPSCGYSGMCVFLPLNSSGERTSTSGFFALLCASVSSLNARILESSRSLATYCVAGYFGTSVENGRPSCSHFARPPSTTFVFVNPKSWNTQNAYVAHQLLLSP